MTVSIAHVDFLENEIVGDGSNSEAGSVLTVWRSNDGEHIP